MRIAVLGLGFMGSTHLKAWRSIPEAELVAGFESLGLPVPATAADPLAEREISGDIWWLNKDSRGGLWINGRDKREGEILNAPSEDVAGAPLESAPGERFRYSDINFILLGALLETCGLAEIHFLSQARIDRGPRHS